MVRAARALLILTLFIPAGVAGADALSAPWQVTLDLVLPQGRKQSFALSERQSSRQTWYYSAQSLDGFKGQGEIEEVSALLDSARGYFEKARDKGLLPDCTIPASAGRGSESIILLDSLAPQALTGAEERKGYANRFNPGPIIESKMWEDRDVEMLILHEMVHTWCASRTENQSPHGRWLEEGVADWVVFATLGAAPQAWISDYFENPCAPTFYGSSFLWVLSRVLSDRDPAYALALLHLGDRKDFGGAVTIRKSISSKPAPACAAARQPVAYGRVSSDCPVLNIAGTQECVPLYRMSGGNVQARPPTAGIQAESAGFFIWYEAP